MEKVLWKPPEGVVAYSYPNVCLEECTPIRQTVPFNMKALWDG